MNVSARFLTVSIAISLALILPAAAGATTSSSSSCGSACDQYTQQAPTGGGSVKSGAGEAKKVRISKRVQKVVKKLPKQTRELVTRNVFSQGGGATATAKAAKQVKPAKQTKPVTKVRSVNQAPAATNVKSSLGQTLLGSFSPGEGSGGRLIVLLVVIMSITAVLGISAARRQRALSRAQR